MMPHTNAIETRPVLGTASIKATARRLLCSTLAAVLTLQPAVNAYAANHPNTSIQNVNIVNLTANVDWDYDGPAPTQVSTNTNGRTPVILTKEVIEKQIFREFARKMFLMTEGRHRIGTIYVYKNARFKNSVDLQLFNTVGRSNASTNAWQNQAGTSHNYLSIENTPYGLTQYANVLAHEMGHYMYGLLDEYREEPAEGKVRTAASTANPGMPAGFDTTKVTMMHQSNETVRLSVAEDYAGNPLFNNTAQARVFSTDLVNLRGGSAWEVLTRDPANDPPLAKAAGARTYFDAFKNFTPPSTVSALKNYIGSLCALPWRQCTDEADVTVPGPSNTPVVLADQRVPVADRVTDVNEWQSRLWQKSGGTLTQDAADGAAGSAFENFKIVFADSPNPAPGVSAGVARNAIIINRAVPAAIFERAVDTAVSLVNRAPAGSQLTVIATPIIAAAGETQNGGAEVLVGLTSVDTGKDALVAALRALKRVEDAPQLQAAYDRFAALFKPARQAADTSEVFFITERNGSAYVPSADFNTTVRADRVPFTITELEPPAAAKSARKNIPLAIARFLGVSTNSDSALTDLAKASGGRVNAAKTAEEAIKEATRASEFAQGKSPALLTGDTFTIGAKGGKSTMTVKSTVHDTSVTAKWYFDPVDAAKVSFKLTPPVGSPSTALATESNLSEGYAAITLPSGSAVGTWTAEVNYNADMTEEVSAEILSNSAVQLVVSTEGGTASQKGKPPVLRAALAGDFPIAEAQVTADVYNQDTGEMVLSGVVLKDDGLGLDSRPNDGIYTFDLSNKLPAGEYEAVFTAVSTAGTVFQPNQIFIPGSNVPTTPVGLGLVRLETMDFALDAGATGVAAAAATPPATAASGPTTTAPGTSAGTSTGTGTGIPAGGLAASGGGCTVVTGQTDAGLLLLLLSALSALALRRRTRSTAQTHRTQRDERA